MSGYLCVCMRKVYLFVTIENRAVIKRNNEAIVQKIVELTTSKD